MRVPATLYVEGDLQEVLNLETVNVSSRGAFLRSNRIVPAGVKVGVELRLALSEVVRMFGSAGNVRITVEGEVVRTEEGGIAVEFSNNYRIEPVS